MSLVTLPTLFRARTCLLELSTAQRVSSSPISGVEQAVDLLGERWLMEVSLPLARRADAQWREAFVNSMRGQTNWVALYHFERAAPRGTMRGSPTLVGSHSQGAASLSITAGTANSTLLAGDLLGVNGLLLMVAADVTLNGSGAGTVQLCNRLRAAQSNGAAVAWDKPTALFRLLSNSGVMYQPGNASETSLSFAEKI